MWVVEIWKSENRESRYEFWGFDFEVVEEMLNPRGIKLEVNGGEKSDYVRKWFWIGERNGLSRFGVRTVFDYEMTETPLRFVRSLLCKLI